MPNELFALAGHEGIVVEWWPFMPPVEGIYWARPPAPPVIGLRDRLAENRARLRCVLAEELGHHYTSAGRCILAHCSGGYGRLKVGCAEERARRWAAMRLIPGDNLAEALAQGITGIRDLAEHFAVTREMAAYRLRLSHVTGEVLWKEGYRC